MRPNLERQKKRQCQCQLAGLPSPVRMQIKVKVETESFLYTEKESRGEKEFCIYFDYLSFDKRNIIRAEAKQRDSRIRLMLLGAKNPQGKKQFC